MATQLNAVESKNGNTVDDLFSAMMDMITTGQWVAGQRIPSENELKEVFNVSRNSVRQTIQRMRALGILEARRGDGTFVMQVDSSNYLDTMLPSIMMGAHDQVQLMEFHQGLQVESVKLACLRRTQEQLDALESALRRMKKAVQESNTADFLSSDTDCHLLVAHMSGNKLFIKASETVYRRLDIYLRHSVNTYGFTDSTLYHELIANAIAEQDVPLAAALMESHLTKITDRLCHLTRPAPLHDLPEPENQTKGE